MWLLRLLILLLWTAVTLIQFIRGPITGPVHTNPPLSTPWIIAADLVVPIVGNIPPPDEPSGSEPAMLEVWREPASAWMEVALQLIANDATSAPRAARTMMLLSVALHDGTIVARQPQHADQAISIHALYSAIATRILAHMHPLHAERVQQLGLTARWVGVWQGEDSAESLIPSSQLGTAVADAVLDWAATDGANVPVGEPQPPAIVPGRWAPTPPNYASAELPTWAHVRTVVIGDPAALRVPAPPAWDDPAMDAERNAFRQAQQIGAAEQILATTWAGGAGTVTPPGIWMQRAIGLVQRDGTTTEQATRIYAALSIALHDTAVACWESKYHYQVARPIQDAAMNYPVWKPYLPTPPHPAYPSGHASFSGAAATILGAFFPTEAAQLQTEAEAAAWSRVVGGIHWPMDGRVGLDQGHRVAELVLARSN